MKHVSFFCILAMAFAFCSCEKDDEEDVNNALSEDSGLTLNSIKQVDMTVVVPIHPSSLKYFDYVVRYFDNQGAVHDDTIQGTLGGIVVDDWNYVDIEITLAATKAASNNNNCYIRTFSYANLPVSCNVSVEMIPKKDCTSVESFFFYIPKPYIYPNVYYSETSVPNESPDHVMEGVESIKIDSMTISSFQSTYGTTFSSCCMVRDCLDGYEIFLY